MSGHHKQEKTNPVLLFLPLLFIGWIVYYAFSSEYGKGHHHAINADYAPKVEKDSKKEEANFDINTPTAESIKAGKRIYTTSCQTCHGPQGNGDGTKSVPPPRNFHNAAEFKFGTSYEDVFATVTKGSPGTSMAGFDYLPQDDRTAVVHYISQWIPGAKGGSTKDVAASGAGATSAEKTQEAPKKEDVKLDDATMDKVLEKLAE